MATFDESQITSLARIFGTNSDVMGLHLDLYAGIITDADKTAILLDVTAYGLVQDNDVSIDPKERNFGARIGADTKRSLIKQRIGGLIQFQVSSGSRLVRA